MADSTATECPRFTQQTRWLVSAYQLMSSAGSCGVFAVVLLLPSPSPAGEAYTESPSENAANEAEAVPRPLRLYRTDAEKGDAQAQVLLAHAYLVGADIDKDEKKAFRWYQKAAEQGHSLAQANLGQMYWKGVGVEQNYDQAWKWYRKAAEQNLPGAYCDMGNMYKQGAGVPVDIAKAIDCYRKDRALGNLPAAHNLGLEYWRGNVLRRSILSAQHCFAEAAKGGLAVAYYQLARTYEQAEVILRVGETNSRRLALENYRKAAAMGITEAERELRRLNASEM